MPLILSRRSALVALLVALVLGGGLLFPAVASAQTSLEARLQRAVLTQINQERRAHHLPALSLNAKLDKSARAHSVAMSAQQTMSHQLRKERAFTARISSTGYRWRAVGENIGWTSDTTVRGIQNIQSMMYNERPPNDGHRLNILNKTYRNIGISVVYDSRHHRLWLTEDFGRLW